MIYDITTNQYGLNYNMLCTCIVCLSRHYGIINDFMSMKFLKSELK